MGSSVIFKNRRQIFMILREYLDKIGAKMFNSRDLCVRVHIDLKYHCHYKEGRESKKLFDTYCRKSKLEAMSGRSMTIIISDSDSESESDSTSIEVSRLSPQLIENGVDVILDIFPPDVSLDSTESMENVASSPEIGSEVTFVYESSESSDSCDSKNQNLLFDVELGSSYGFIELNVNYLIYYLKYLKVI